jgi:hypothetical protein
MVTPIVGIIPWPYQFQVSTDEVSRVFSIPIVWLANADNYTEEERMMLNGSKRMAFHYKEYQGETVWGLTANITVGFLKMLGLIK